MFPTASDLKDNEACLKLVEEATTNAKQIQEAVLEKILTENAGTEYLKRFLDGKSSKEVFKNNVPLVSYQDLRPFIQRVANGEPSELLCAQPFVEFMVSSGTSGGMPKLLPVTDQDMDRRQTFLRLIKSVLTKCVEVSEESISVFFVSVTPEFTTPSGLVARAATTTMCKDSRFRDQVWNGRNAVYKIVQCEDMKQSLYCQFLCGLVLRDSVISVGAAYASTFLKLIKFLEEHWSELCSNIRIGRVSDWISDSGCKDGINSILLKPDPELADLIETECSKKSWEGIIRKLWPKAEIINTIITGSMAQYIPLVKFYGGGLPLVSTLYASSECFLGINLNPLCNPSDVSYTFIPNMAYFEFLSVTDDQIVDLADVQIGHLYQVVVTTFNGLYRYKMGDTVMVTGFYNKSPQVKFIQRQNIISIHTEKTSEADLFKAVTDAKVLVENRGVILMDYTCFVDLSSLPGHYVLFWELKSVGEQQKIEIDPETFEQCCFMVEESLDYQYRRCRKIENTIGPLEIRVVRQGTFDKLMDLSVSSGTSMSQYKTPRCIKSEKVVELLDSGVIGKFFSRKIPSWEP